LISKAILNNVYDNCDILNNTPELLYNMYYINILTLENHYEYHD